MSLPDGPRAMERVEDFREGVACLCHAAPPFAQAARAAAPLRLRRQKEGFATLLKIIVSQQLSLASAASVWGRIEKAGFLTVDGFLQADDATLRRLGLSGAKIRYGRVAAEKVRSGALPLAALRGKDDDEVMAALTAIEGIGAWSAELYLIFALGRPDICAAGDLALREAARMLFALDARPDQAAYRRMAEEWRPWRSVAALLLWAWHRHKKGQPSVW